MFHLRTLFILIALLLSPFAGGCAVLGVLASKMPEADVDASYKGLNGQRVAVMVWTDRATRFDYSTMGSDVQGDISRTIVQRLRLAAPHAAELKDAIILDARGVYLWQKNHPEFENRGVIEIAPALGAAVGATRLIHVEMPEFNTKDPRNDILLRGYGKFNLRVVEIAGTSAKVVYEEAGVVVNFPEKSPEGVPPSETVNQEYVYRGLRDAIGTTVAIRFFQHPGVQ